MAKRYPIENARTLRSQRARTLEALQEGTLPIRDALRKPPGPIRGVAIYTLLTSCKGLGPETAKKVLLEARVWPLAPVGKLHPQLRLRIFMCLPERYRDGKYADDR